MYILFICMQRGEHVCMFAHLSENNFGKPLLEVDVRDRVCAQTNKNIY